MALRFVSIVAGLACLLAVAVAPARAALPQVGGAADLASLAPNSVFDGGVPGDHAGTVVVDAGDVNGDGIDDALVTAPNADPSGRRDAGSAFVVFGAPRSAESLDIFGLGPRVLRVDGSAAGEHFGWS